jgi:hypothetical protein
MWSTQTAAERVPANPRRCIEAYDLQGQAIPGFLTALAGNWVCADRPLNVADVDGDSVDGPRYDPG